MPRGGEKLRTAHTIGQYFTTHTAQSCLLQGEKQFLHLTFDVDDVKHQHHAALGLLDVSHHGRNHRIGVIEKLALVPTERLKIRAVLRQLG